MTSAFPASAPNHSSVQLDNIIFYSGPTSAKPCKATSTDARESPGFDAMFAGASWQEWTADVEHLEVAGGLVSMIEGKPYTARPNHNLLSDAIEIQIHVMQSIRAGQRRRLRLHQRIQKSSANH